ncbi:hypothetical protein [Streptosporangium oxazolinicum]|uniref:hypothetical protein n=1 Tax=Streptosporangium oxazolinicum TaxID=909287 RepID=UPI0031E4EE1B
MAEHVEALYRPFQDVEGGELRLHRTVLYNSIYRADNELLINLHAYGTRAPEAPVIYLTHTEANSTATTYLADLPGLCRLAIGAVSGATGRRRSVSSADLDAVIEARFTAAGGRP